MSPLHMLELAAKACGYTVRRDIEAKDCLAIKDPKGYWPSEYSYWNPLTDSRDAFEAALAAHLTISVGPDLGGALSARAYTGSIGASEVVADDLAAAARLAITRALAALGETL